MSDFQLRPPMSGASPTANLSLGNFQLQLDPVLAREIRCMANGPVGPVLRNMCLRPNWRQMRQDELERILRQPVTAPVPIVPPGAGPAQPRAGEVSDVLSAIMAIPAVQQAGEQVLNRASQTLARDWRNASGLSQALIITQGALIVGGVGVGLSLGPTPPEWPANLIMNRDIPVPGVTGLSFQFRHRGGQVSWSNILGSGVSANLGGGASGGPFQAEAMITLDLHQWLPALQ